jgi:Nucleotidyl transferase of unknown function (DUF2204)
MLSALSAEGVEHLLVGAYAMAVHGVPRATGDIDLWVRPSQANAAKVLRALARYGAPIGALTLDDLAKPGTVFQIGVAPHRIDVLTAIDGVEFEKAWSRRTTTDIAGLTVPVIGREDLIRNKRSTGRARDEADADRLENPE